MPLKPAAFLMRYGFAVFTIALATWVRLLLDPALGHQFPFATVFVAILLTAWYGGFRPALAAVVFGALSTNYFIMPPRGSLVLEGRDQQVGMALYCSIGLGIALLGGVMDAARQSAEAGAQAERRQVALIDQTYDAVLVWDWKGAITFWNRGAERLYGFPRAEAVGRVSHELLRTTRPGGVNALIDVLEREDRWEGELEHATRDGQRIIVESRMVLVRQAERPFVLEANRDISGRLRLEAELRTANSELESRVRERTAELAQANDSLRATEERFRLLIEGVREYAIFMLDPTGNVVTWNAGAERNKGYRAEDIIGRHFSCFYPEEDVARGKPEQGLQHARTEGRYEDEGWRVRQDGSRFWAKVVITALHDQTGQLRGFAKVTRDITGGVRAQERFSQVVESALNALVMINPDGKIVLVNAQTEKLFGYDRHELLGQAVELLVPERFRTKHPQYRADFFAKPQVRAMGVGRDLRGRRKDGSEFPVEIGLNPIKTNEGLVVLSAIVDITERKRAEERFRQAVESAPNGMVMINSEGIIVLVNAQTEKLFGYRRDELLGQSIELLVPERFRSKHPEYRAGFFAKPQVRSMGGGRDLFGRRKDGSEFPVEIGLNPIKSDEGFLVLSAIVDISERKRAESALRDRERILGIVTGSARVGLVVVALGYRYLFANEAYAEIFGLNANEIVGRRIPDLLAAAWPQIQPRLDQALAGEQVVYELTMPPLPASKMTRSFSVVYEPRTSDDGEPTVVVVVVDISERKHAEEALRESEQRLRLFIEYAPAALAMFDHQMRYLSASRRWLADYSLPDEDIVGRSHYELIPVPERWKSVHRRGLAGEVLRADEDRFERADGRTQWLKWEVRPWRRAEGAIGGIVIFAEDITERKFAQQALQRANADLQRSVQQLAGANRELRARTQETEAFVYSVSHDLRSPLVNLQGFSKELSLSLQDLRSHLEKSAERRPDHDSILEIMDGPMAKAIRFIQTAVTRLSNIIDALLRLSRAGRVDYQRQRVDVQAVVRRVVDSLRVTREERGASIHVDELPPANADPAAVEQIFANLIGNALNYLDSKRPGLIDVGCLDSVPDDAAESLNTYYVCDNGLGIAETGRAKVFQPFQRLHPRAAAGEGMGLAVVQRVVERLGGKIWFESVVGRGTTFFVALPAFPDRAPAALAPAPPSPSP